MLFFLILFIFCLNFALVAHLWGADSRDGINSREWELRQQWYGFH